MYVCIIYLYLTKQTLSVCPGSFPPSDGSLAEVARKTTANEVVEVAEQATIGWSMVHVKYSEHSTTHMMNGIPILKIQKGDIFLSPIETKLVFELVLLSSLQYLES